MQPHVKQSESRRYSLDGWRLVAEGDSSNSPVEGQIVFGSHLSSHPYDAHAQTVQDVTVYRMPTKDYAYMWAEP